MYYFDNKFLMHYLNLNSDLKVYVDQEYYQITDPYDISDPDTGYGYTVYGEPRQFDYKAIEQIMVGNKIFTLDQLQSAYSTKQEEPKDSEKEEKPAEEESEAEETPTEEEPAEEESAEEESAEEESAEEEPAEEEEEQPQESVKLGSYIQNIDPTHSKFNTKGGVVLIENGYITYEFYSNEKGGMTQVSVKPNQVRLVY